MPDGTVPDAIQPLVVCGANAESNGCGYGTASLDPTTGAYQITGLLPGSYHVSARYDGSSPDVIQSVDSSNVDVADGQDVRLDLQFEAGAVITGHLTGSDGPLSSAIVTGSWDSGASSGATQATFDPATQTYRFDRLYPQTYTIRFSSTRYGDVTAPPVTVTFGQVVSGVDEVLPRENQISGQLSYDDGSGPVARQGKVSLISSGAEIASTTSDATGHYEFNGVAPGDYRICANGIGYFAQACWGDGGELDAPNVSIASGGSAVGKDITQVAGGILKAQVNMPPEPGGFSVGYEAEVDVWRLDQSAGYYTLFQKFTANEGGTGTVEDEGLPAGTYRVQFIDPLGTYNAQWWSGARYFSDGEDITLSPNQVTDLGKVALMPRTLDVYRTSGSDRYTGSVEMSKETYPSVPNDGVPIVYVANGLNYPDALSAGPAAIAQGGVLLLVSPTQIPSAVAGELQRLRPQKIAVAGGPASVSDAVLSQLTGYVQKPSDVFRLSGADRFAASRSITRSVFLGDGAREVFIATGNNFPDALSAGPAAGSIGAPVILVNGLLPALDSETRRLLLDLGTTDVDIAGGPGSVSPGIEASLDDLMGGSRHVHRYTGATRYEAAAAIGAEFFPDPETVFLATGANFPDALAGAPLAGAVGGPIYLSQPDCLSDVDAGQIVNSDTQLIWLLGGPASLSPAVEDLHVC
ncbi:cell wall-binding repeat-containing protein [Pseudolysinimonas kribbensis]|uniref:cell wall-binding repeat-containing protein n=1 Tax=Pseudolysinimonas kribbensis TaxID=433641 RepID=UPI0031D21A5D